MEGLVGTIGPIIINVCFILFPFNSSTTEKTKKCTKNAK